MSSYSSVECFKKCPYQWKLKYVDKIKVIKDQDPSNALYLGLAIHKGLETESVEQAIEEYKSHYYRIGDQHVEEMIKLETMLKKALAVKHTLGDTFIHELEFQEGTFKGFVDLLVDNHDGTFDLYDYKYCSPKSVDKYINSPQLHVYRYILERMGYKIRNMGYMFIPKCFIKQKREKTTYKKRYIVDPVTKKRKTVNALDDKGKPIILNHEHSETTFEFRKRLDIKLTELDVFIKMIEYRPTLVMDIFLNAVTSVETTIYIKQPNDLCSYCDFENYCQNGDDSMMIPQNVRRNLKVDENPDIWIYADSYVGKSTFIDQYEDLLFLNTDGNTDNTTSPVLPIKKTITYNGRIREEMSAWEVFENVVVELEESQAKGTLEFKRVAIDLIEDVYEYCRQQIYDENGWSHESDGGYGKGYDLVKTRFTSAIKRLKSIGLQVIYISKELKETVQHRNGTSYNTFKPNVQEKIANMLAGTVDLTVRAYMEGSSRFINLQKNDSEFGGGRFDFKTKRCELSMPAFLDALRSAQDGKTFISSNFSIPADPNCVDAKESLEPAPRDDESQTKPIEEEQKPQRRTKRSVKQEDTNNDNLIVTEKGDNIQTSEDCEDPEDAELLKISTNPPKRTRRSRREA